MKYWVVKLIEYKYFGDGSKSDKEIESRIFKKENGSRAYNAQLYFEELLDKVENELSYKVSFMVMDWPKQYAVTNVINHIYYKVYLEEFNSE